MTFLNTFVHNQCLNCIRHSKYSSTDRICCSPTLELVLCTDLEVTVHRRCRQADVTYIYGLQTLHIFYKTLFSLHTKDVQFYHSTNKQTKHNIQDVLAKHIPKIWFMYICELVNNNSRYIYSCFYVVLPGDSLQTRTKHVAPFNMLLCLTAENATCILIYSSDFLGAFAKLRKASISFVMSVRPSVCPHGTARLTMDGF